MQHYSSKFHVFCNQVHAESWTIIATGSLDCSLCTVSIKANLQLHNYIATVTFAFVCLCVDYVVYNYYILVFYCFPPFHEMMIFRINRNTKKE
jgi:hypothetical protein